MINWIAIAFIGACSCAEIYYAVEAWRENMRHFTALFLLLAFGLNGALIAVNLHALGLLP